MNAIVLPCPSCEDAIATLRGVIEECQTQRPLPTTTQAAQWVNADFAVLLYIAKIYRDKPDSATEALWAALDEAITTFCDHVRDVAAGNNPQARRNIWLCQALKESVLAIREPLNAARHLITAKKAIAKSRASQDD
jgi:hypothetical protein